VFIIYVQYKVKVIIKKKLVPFVTAENKNE